MDRNFDTQLDLEIQETRAELSLDDVLLLAPDESDTCLNCPLAACNEAHPECEYQKRKGVRSVRIDWSLVASKLNPPERAAIKRRAQYSMSKRKAKENKSRDRKGYLDKYYEQNRERKLKAASERYHAQKTETKR